MTNEESLTPKDYALLDSIKRENLKFSLKLGIIEGLEMNLKLMRAGLIEKLNREATLDEKEKMQAFIDSPAQQKRLTRIQKLASKEDIKKIKEIVDELGAKSDLILLILLTKARKCLRKSVKR